MAALPRKLVAIHQPNFFPWLGFFDKVRRSDVFIALDNVQFPKTGGTWTNRVQVMVDGEPAWVSMPIVRAYHGVRAIREMQIAPDTMWRGKLLRKIEHNYRRAPEFDDVFPWLAPLIENPTSSVAEYNLASIQALCRRLGIRTPIRLGSELAVEGRATDLLISMVKAVGGSEYLAGGGAAGYQEDEEFQQAGIQLTYQSFHHPTYPQTNTAGFEPGLSIIDALMNCGVAGTTRLLEQGG